MLASLVINTYPDMSMQDDNEERWKHIDSIWVLIAKFLFIVLLSWEDGITAIYSKGTI